MESPSTREDAAGAGMIRGGNRIGALIASQPINGKTFARHWLAQRFAAGPCLIDALAEAAGLGGCDGL